METGWRLIRKTRAEASTSLADAIGCFVLGLFLTIGFGVLLLAALPPGPGP